MITLVVQVEDKPGVLARVTTLVRRRAFNIESLAVGHTDTAGVSSITIVVDTDDWGARRLEANLYKLVTVLRVVDVTRRPAVFRELAMIKVAATPETRPAIMQVVEVFRARAVDVSLDTLIVEITGSQEKIEGLVEVLKPYGILDVARTGRLAMARGPHVANENGSGGSALNGGSGEALPASA